VKIVILGAGALGSILAGQLIRAAEDVTLLARGARARHLAAHGLTLRGLADYTVPVNVVTDPGEVGDCDLLIVTVKTYDMEAALTPLRHVRAASVISVQNGVVKNEQLAAAFGRPAVLGCAANFSGEVDADGVCNFTRNVGLLIGELPAGVSLRVQEVVATIDRAGVKTLAVDNIQTVEWSKFVAWLALTPPAVLARLPTHVFLQDPDTALLVVQLAREAVALATGLGVEVDDSVGLAPAKALSTLPLDEAIAFQQGVGNQMAAAPGVPHRMSGLQDVERGRRLEVEETLGYVVHRAAELGVDVPRTDACYRLIAALSRASVG
jgi:2-dehydropantoate 2-reductase